MRTMTLAYNPNHVKLDDLEAFAAKMLREHQCLVYYIPHWSSNSEPIYCVQFTDTKVRQEFHFAPPHAPSKET